MIRTEQVALQAEALRKLRTKAAGWAAHVAVTVSVAAAVLGTGLSWSRGPETAEAPVASAALPMPARQTLQLIRAGGPFPYQKDGTVFGNRERLLPARPRGHYREYTVPTPGANNRGARRIVCGGAPPTTPEACYYTADHYASFRRIVQ